MTADDRLLVVDDADGVRTITINRPEVRNALTAAMRTEFCALIDEADADDGTRAIIVTAVDPVFAAAQDAETVICMHIGSSSKMPTTSPDAPFIVSSTLTFSNAMGSMVDYIFSGTLERFPKLTLAYSEGQVGWMPYVMERADKLAAERSDNSFGTSLPQPPSSYVSRIYGCIFDDEIGLANRDVIGMDQICFETDYPHADSTFPHSKKVVEDICTQAGLNDEERYKLLRGNAITAFGLERFGITK